MIYVFDLDGTISDASHRLHYLSSRPKNWDAFFSELVDDPPFPAMIEFIKVVSRDFDSNVIFQTGRPEKYRRSTDSWLAKHGLMNCYNSLLMRPDGDFRSNVNLKLDFLDFIQEKNNGESMLWIEDAVEVVKAINKQGVLALSAQYFVDVTASDVTKLEIPCND